MKTYRIYAEFENGTEQEIIVKDTSSTAKAEMSLFLSDMKSHVARCHLDKWCNEMECWLEVPCKLSFNKY